MSNILRDRYYDRYDPSKQYTQLLAVAGRVAQAREITEIQTTIKDIIRNIGDALLSTKENPGSIIEGCSVSVTIDETDGKKVLIVSPGKVYIGGMVLPVVETRKKVGESVGNHVFTGEGIERVGYKLLETVVTYEDDSELRDPATSYANEGNPGCDRLKSVIEIVMNDDSAAQLATLEDGIVTLEKYAPNYSAMEEMLARRTNNESGSYIVNGLKVRIENDPIDDRYCNVLIDPGTAYVRGYEIPIINPVTRRINRSTGTYRIDPVQANFTYSTNGIYVLDYYGPYVESLYSVRGYTEDTETISNTGIGNFTILAQDNIDQMTVSIDGLVKDIDYSVSSEMDSLRVRITWLNDNHKGEFLVYYRYMTEFKDSCEITYVTDSEKGIYQHQLTWMPAKPSPVADTPLWVHFNRYLARKDLVCIHSNGSIEVIEGVANYYGRELIPQTPDQAMTLATISHPPGGKVSTDPLENIVVSNIGLTRFTMRDIQKIVDRVKTIEYDQAVLSLENAARNYDASANKKGIWTDPLVDYSRLAYKYNRIINDTEYKFDATLDLLANICYLPTLQYTTDSLSARSGSSYGEYTRAITLEKTGKETSLQSQLKATEVFRVNPYSAFPRMPEISITPATDSWISEDIINIPVSRQSTEIVKTSTRHTASSRVLGSIFNDYSVSEITGIVDTELGRDVKTTSSSSVVSEEAATYIRSRTITVRGSNFHPGLRNIACYIGGVQCELTPLGGTSAGVQGTINPDSTGKFSATFTIPKDTILTGIREVKLSAIDNTSVPSDVITSASALYQAAGTNRTIQRTITTLTTILLHRVTEIHTITYIDPVGQTFILDKSVLLKGIDLYFEEVGNAPITCEIREVLNGSITATVYGHRTLDPEKVNGGGVATRFNFEDPILLESNKEYAFVVRSTSSECTLWVAKLGRPDITTGETVLSNPYMIGVMMSSSNNSSWSMHQDMDIKFELWADEYVDSSTVYFDDITSEELQDKIEDFSRLYLLADSILPSGTKLDWEYSIDRGASYAPIAPYTMESLGSMRSEVSIRAKLSGSTNKNLSPIIVADSVELSLSKYDKDTGGMYISNMTSELSEYNKAEIILDAYYPDYSTDIEVSIGVIRNIPGSGETIEMHKLTPTKDKISGRWVEQVYSTKLSEKADNFRVFIKMSSPYAYLTPAFRRLRAIVSEEI